MNSSPKDVIEHIRSQWSDGVSSFIQENVHNALERLSQDLYSKDSHFVLELIQNADDNAYEVGVVPKLAFLISKGGILVLNNEKGFEEPHIRSLCSIGKSTKSKVLGYIGEKGIGFKSVFKVTDEPHIFSNGYRFKFMVKDSSDPIGFVVPHWIDAQPRYARSRLTTLYLPLREKAEGVLRYFDDLDPHLLLFLKKLKAIEIHNKIRGEHRLLECETLSESRVALHATTWRKDGHRQKNTQQFLLSHTELEKPAKITEAKRSEVTSSTLLLAFPLSNNGVPLGKADNQVFAFLPVRQFGFRFTIQADFLVPANREDIHRDKDWNKWLRDALARSFSSALPQFKENEPLMHTFYGFLPREGEVKDDFFRPAVDALYSKLSTTECVQTEFGHWERPCNVLLADDMVRQLVSNQELQRMMGLEYAHPRIKRGDIPSKLGCIRFGLDHLFRCLMDSQWLSGKPDNWFAVLFSYLAEHAITPEMLATVRQLQIFPIVGGTLTSLNEGPIFLPEKRRKRYEFESELRLLRPDIISSSASTPAAMLAVLTKLGLRPFSARAIVDGYILPLYVHGGWKRKSMKTLQSHLVFIKDHLEGYIQEARTQDQLTALTRLRTALLICSSSKNAAGGPIYASASKLYLSREFGAPHDLERLFEGIPGVTFVSSNYLGDAGSASSKESLNSQRNWGEFFIRLGVNVVPRVISVAMDEYVNRRSIRSYMDYQFSDEIRQILSDDKRLKEFLRILDASWSSSYKMKARRRYSSGDTSVESSFLAELRGLPVPTVEGTKKPLGSCILNSIAVQNLFGPDAPILTVKFTNSEMIAELGISVQPTLDFALNQLRRFKREAIHDFGIVRKFYGFLHARFDENPAQIRESFKSESLILAGSNERVGFYSISQVYWRDFGPRVESARVSLRAHFSDLYEFFVTKIGVAELPSIDDLASVLKELAKKTNPTSSELKTIFAIYHDLNEHIAKLDSASDTTWLRELMNSCILWTNKREFRRNDGDVFINDNAELFNLFADSPIIAFLGVPEDDVPILAALAKYADIKPVSKVVITSFLNAESQAVDDELSLFLRSLLYPLARYLRFKMNKVYRDARERQLFNNLACIECRMVDHLMVEYKLNAEVRTSVRSSAFEGSNLYLSASCPEAGDAIAQEYANHLGGGDELANFVALLCVRRNLSGIEALLDSRQIPPLPEEDKRYFRELTLPGARAAGLIPRGILHGEGERKIAGPTTAGSSATALTTRFISVQANELQEVPDSSDWVPEVAPTAAADATAEEFLPKTLMLVSVTPSSSARLPRPSGLVTTDRSNSEYQIAGGMTNHAYAIGHWGEEWVVWTHLRQKYVSAYGEASVEQSATGFIVRCAQNTIEVVWLNAATDQYQPYDVLIREKEVEKFIEVKSSTTDSIEWFDVSGNQWNLAMEAGSYFTIYRVYRAGTAQPRLKIIDDLKSRWLKHELQADPIRIKL
jgi:Domain of unknown function (DUF3883)